MRLSDRLLSQSSKTIGVGLLFLFIAIVISLMINSHLTWHTFHLKFITHTDWNPITNQFGALTAIIGTLVTSAIAVIIALPISLAIAALTSNILPKKLSGGVGFALQILAGIPSIIYGMWGLFILAPFLAVHVQPFLTNTLGQLPLIGPLFNGPAMGIGVFTAGVVLAIMIIPLLANMMINLFAKVPPLLTESGYATGATRYEIVKKIQLPFLRSGIIGSVILGLGRALGETMAVTFVIGNTHLLSSSLFMPGNTIASTIANEFTEATGKLYSSSIMGLALILVGITFTTIIIARLLLNRVEH